MVVGLWCEVLAGIGRLGRVGVARACNSAELLCSPRLVWVDLSVVEVCRVLSKCSSCRAHRRTLMTET